MKKDYNKMSEAEKILADVYNEKYYPAVEGITKGAESHFPCKQIAEYFSQRGIYKDKEWDSYVYKEDK